MINVIRLLEANFPGHFTGKEVVTKDSKKIGVCSSIILDLNEKEVYIIVSGKDYLFKIPLKKVISVENDFIIVDYEPPITISISSNDLQQKLDIIRSETLLLAQLLSTKIRNVQAVPNTDRNYIAKLFHLV